MILLNFAFLLLVSKPPFPQLNRVFKTTIDWSPVWSFLSVTISCVKELQRFCLRILNLSKMASTL